MAFVEGYKMSPLTSVRMRKTKLRQGLRTLQEKVDNRLAEIEELEEQERQLMAQEAGK